jgi:Cu/Ag efflux protein CusF
MSYNLDKSRTMLLECACCFLWLAADASGVELTGVVRGVDAAARTITIERQAGGSVKAMTLDVAPQAEGLDRVKKGSSIAVTFDPEAESVTSLRVTAMKADQEDAKAGSYPADATPFQGHHFKVFLEPLTWVAAQQRCQSMGGHLPVLSNKAKAEFLVRLAQRSGLPKDRMDGVWIGATDKDEEGEWVWVDGSPMKYSDWFPNQPNNKQNSEHYAMVWIEKGKWCDQPVSSQQHTTYFVCEWDE